MELSGLIRSQVYYNLKLHDSFRNLVEGGDLFCDLL